VHDFSTSERYEWRLLASLWLVIVISAIAFVALSNRPVFDDISNLRDVTRYAKEGVSVTTVANHVNPAGPFGYIWIALNGAIIGGDLWSFRLVNALGTLVLGGALLWLARHDRGALTAACLLLVNPYLPLASATILTEIPSLLMLVAGTLLWVHAQAEIVLERGAPVRWPGTVKLLCGSVLLGFAITSRQYYLAILPAMAFTFLVSIRRLGRAPSARSVIAVLTSGVIAGAPIAGLFVIWGGLTPPGMQQNISYPNQIATIELNPLRPLSAALYIGLYMLPPFILQPHTGARVLRILVPLALIMACLLVISVPKEVFCGALQGNAGCGPITWLYDVVSARSPNLAVTYNSIVAFAGFVGLFLLMHAIWSDRDAIFKIPGAVLCSAFVVFFVIEQFFIGGNIPFFERYILQIAPMLGLVLGGSPRFKVDRALIGSAPMIVYGLFRLWRNF
jgi:hypothetical protein